MKLTPSERKVAELLLTGADNKTIAHTLGTHVSTVTKHMSRMFTKAGIRTGVKRIRLAVKLYYERGLWAILFLLAVAPILRAQLVVSTTAECGTSIDGSVVGIVNPVNPPQVTTGFSGTLGSGNYFVEIAWYNAAGQTTLLSPEVQVQLTATGQLQIAPPASGMPAAAAGANIYIGTTSGGEAYQGTVVGSGTYIQSTPIAGSPASTTSASLVATTGSPVNVVVTSASGFIAGDSVLYDTGSNQETVTITSINLSVPAFLATFTKTHGTGVAIVDTVTRTLPTTNTTVCNVVANDAGWPTGTGYQVTLTSPAGGTLPGYPQQWQLLGPGNTINLSQGIPRYNGTVQFPVPILAQPYGNAPQSISGPLNLGAYSLTAGTINVGTLNISGTLNLSSFAVANNGLFTNTQINSYVQSLVNNCSLLTEYQASEGNTNYFTGGVAGCVATPASSTIHETDGVIGFVNNGSTSTDAVGVRGTGRATATNANVWGGDFTASDGGFAVSQVYAIEADLDSTNAASSGTAFLVGDGHIMPSNNFSAITIVPPTNPLSLGIQFLPVSGVAPCITCLLFQTGSTVAPGGSGSAIQFDPVASGTGQASQGLLFVAADPASGNNLVAVNEAANGNFVITNSKSGAGIVGNNIPIVGSLTTTSATSDTVGLFGMTSAGHCWFSPTNSTAATNIATTYISAKTANQITLTHTATSGMTFDIGCTPN